MKKKTLFPLELSVPLCKTSRKALESLADNVILGTPGLSLRLSVPTLCKISSFSWKYPDIYEKVLGKLVDYGILSESPEGRYAVESTLFSDSVDSTRGFFLGPEFKGRRFYFTSWQSAGHYIRKITKKGVFTVCAKAVKQEDFIIPDNPTSLEWRYIRIRHADDLYFARYAIDTLIEKRILVPRTSEKTLEKTFTVVYQPPTPERRKNLNLNWDNKKYSFVNKKHAATFAKSFGSKSVKVIED